MANLKLLALHLNQEETAIQSSQEYFSNSEIEAYLAPQSPEEEDSRRRIHIVELNNSIKSYQLASNLCHQLGCPRVLLQEHVQNSTDFAFNENIIVPKFPSHLNPEERFSLEYFDLRTFTGDPNTLAIPCPNIGARQYVGRDSKYPLVCSSTGRGLQSHEWQDPQRRMLFIVPRKCSFWCKKLANGGWDAIILCDPALTKAKTGATVLDLAPNEPFCSGYRDFIPYERLRRGQGGPPRTSMFDDLRHYFLKYVDMIGYYSDHTSPPIFVKKIAAAQFGPLLAFVSHQAHGMRARGWVLQEDNILDDESRQVERDWSRFRLTEYLEAVESNMDALAIPFAQADPARTRDWWAYDADFQKVHIRLIVVREGYDRITTSIAALASIIGRRQTLIEARNVQDEAIKSREEVMKTKTLTIVAMVFAPLALTSSLFSMTGDYAPGAKHFWVYFAVAIPAAVIVYLIVVLAERGYDRAQWSMSTFLVFLQGWLQMWFRGRDSIKSVVPGNSEEAQISQAPSVELHDIGQSTPRQSSTYSSAYEEPEQDRKLSAESESRQDSVMENSDTAHAASSSGT